MCAADRNLLAGVQSDLCMLEPGNCMKVHKETSVAAHKKIRQLLLENIQFVTDCIGFSFCINKCFTQITFQIQDIIYCNPDVRISDLKCEKLFFICLEIFKCSIQSSRQIFIKPVFVNEIGVLCGIDIRSIFQILADKDQLCPWICSVYHLSKFNPGNCILSQRNIQKNNIIRTSHFWQRSHEFPSGEKWMQFIRDFQNGFNIFLYNLHKDLTVFADCNFQHTHTPENYSAARGSRSVVICQIYMKTGGKSSGGVKVKFS